MDDLERVGNLVEAAFWSAVALVLLVRAFRTRGALRRVFAILAVAFFAFGLSDIAESQTGAWWRPPWLLLWKGICVIVLLLGFLDYYRIKSKALAASDAAPNGGPSAPVDHATTAEGRHQ